MSADLRTGRGGRRDRRTRRLSRPARQRFAVLAALGFVISAGCTGSATTGGSGGATSANPSTVDDQCANIVSSIYDTFQLRRLGQTTTVADGVLRLNDWQQSCPTDEIPVAKFPEKLRAQFSEEQWEALRSPRFTNRDGEHLRNGVLVRALVEFLDKNAADSSELQRVVLAFQFVIRSLELIDKHPQEVPLTPYDLVLFGKGTVADRAWLFARLLQEVRIDSALIVPAGSADEKGKSPDRYLVGAILDGRTYLFDPRAGIPIPPPGAAEDAKKALGVATLDQAADDPEVLRQLDVDEDHSYPFKPQELKRPTVYLITESTFSTDRMRSLQGQFSGKQSIVLADPLQDTNDSPGVWTRVANAGGAQWNEDSLRIWSYPESQSAPRSSLSDDQRKVLRLWYLPFDAYSSPRFDQREGKFVLSEQEQFEDRAAGEFDPAKTKRTRTTKGAQMRARLTQVSGDFAKAVTDYHDVWKRSRELVQGALEKQLTVENEKIALHLRAIDDATFWSAVCKLEQRNYRVAIDHLTRYQKHYANGAWLRQCRYLLALCLAAQEDYQAAVEELEKVGPEDPEYFGYQWLIRQWQIAEPEIEAPAENNPTENSPKAGR